MAACLPQLFRTSCLAVCLICIFGPASGFAEELSEAKLPVKRVVMFSSGVAFFEHAGPVEGDAQVHMQFKVDDINDLLKSMVLQDLGGGKISTVSYASKDPVTRTLQTFAIDLTENPTLADLLNQIRGERIEIDAPNKVVGVILGVEKRKQPVPDGEPVEQAYLNLLTEEGLRSISLDSIGRIKLADPKLDAELRQALTVLAMSHATDKKAVTLNFLGDGERQVRVGYIQQAPVWKTSYRMVLKEDEKALLQGWAIVENPTESDWKGVSLSLVSGRPISFVMDLYEPLYVDRPVVEPELYASLRPRTYDQDLAAKQKEFRKLARSNATRRGGVAAPAAPESAALGFGATSRDVADDPMAAMGENLGIDRGVSAVAQAGDVGELFRYEIEMPVTLERSQSAMLPIVNEEIETEKVSIYNEAVQSKHPLNGLRLKNTTDLHLMQGPITVFDGGTYAGDAQIQDLPPQSERLISYALDLDTEVAYRTDGTPTQLLSARFAKGTLIVTQKQTRSRTYTVKNSGQKARTVLIEYPDQQPWKLVRPEEPAERTRDLYRFKVEAKPGEPSELLVKEEFVQDQSVAITNLPIESIQVYLKAKEISDDVKKALEEVIRRKTELEAVARERQQAEQQIAEIAQQQQRIRENMARVPQDSELFRRYLTKFTEQEDEVERLQEKSRAALEKENKLRADLDAYILAQ